MKTKLLKTLSVILATLCVMGITPVCSFAEEGEKTTFTMLDYNVAGLPDFKALIGQSDGISVDEKEKIIGKTLNETGIDFIAVQEDFNYNSDLVETMTNYEYKTIHSGGVPFGDGLNIYSKTPIYNIEREAWRKTYGVFIEGDQLTPKGILYAVIEIADGVYADFYDIHADAFDTQESQEARVDNYNQLAEMIEKNGHTRPIIITGDFNVSLHLETYDISAVEMRKIFIDKLGMKDAWIECCNNGNYNDFSEWETSGISYWGNWDSVEKFLYCDGGGIHLEAEDFEYINYGDDNIGLYSDHSAAKVTFSYEKTAEYSAPSTDNLKAEKNHWFTKFFQNIGLFFKALWICLTNLGELKVYL